MTESKLQNPGEVTNRPALSRLRRLLLYCTIGIVAVATVIILNRQDRDRHSRESWERYRHDLEAKGETLDWQAFIPPAVPDEQNLCKAPGMVERFSQPASPQSRMPVFCLPQWVTDPPLNLDNIRALPEDSNSTEDSPMAPIATRERLREWFAWNDSEYRLLVEACARPAVRFDADYDNPADMDVPDFVNLRIVAQALVSHAALNLLDAKPDAAVQDLLMLKCMADLSGSSPTLVATMFQVAVLGLYVQTARDALQSGVLFDSHLEAIQRLIREIDLINGFAQSLRMERAIQLRLLTLPLNDLVKTFQPFFGGPSLTSKPLWKFSAADWKAWYGGMRLKRSMRSRRWVFENLTTLCRLQQEVLDQLDFPNKRIHAAASSQVFSNMAQTVGFSKPEAQLAALVMPNYSQATLIMARVQTQLNQLFVACGLERHRLARGSYPETLDVLLPDFLDHVPTDLFAEQRLQYRVTEDGRYELWSVGWNEKDDAGKAAFDMNNQPIYDDLYGDWVWSRRKPNVFENQKMDTR